jgi:anti-sigma B factor antagonist
MRPVPPLPTPLAERPWPGEWSRGIIRAERVDRATVVLSLVGEFDLSTYEPASEVLRHLERAGATLVVIDLGNLTFLASVGIPFLLEAQERADLGGWSLVVVAPPPPADRVLALSGVDNHLNVTRRTPQAGRDGGGSPESSLR